MKKFRIWCSFIFFFFIGLLFSGYIWKEPVLTDSKVNYWLNTDGKDVFYITQNGLLYRLSLISGSQEVLYNPLKPSNVPSTLAKQTIIFGSDDGEIYAYYIPQKKVAWSYSLKKKEENLSANLMFLNSNQNFVAAVYDKKLVVLRVENGAEVFSRYIKNGQKAILTNDKVFLLGDEKIYAYSLFGQLLWFAEIGELFKTLPVYEPTNNILLVPSSNKGILFAFDASSGSLLWFYNVNGFLMSEPVTDSSLVVFGTNDGNIIGLNIKDGSPKYVKNIDYVLWGRGEKLQEKYVFYTSSKGDVIGINISDGEVIFKHRIGLRSYYPLLVNKKNLLLPTTENKIFYLSLDPSCSIFYPEDGKEIGLDTTIVGSAISNAGVKNVQIFINKKPLPILNLEGKNSFSVSADLSSSQAGELEIECLATNSLGEIEINEMGYKTKPIFSEFVSKSKIYSFIEPSLSLDPTQEFTLYIQNQYSKNLNNVLIKYLDTKKIVNSPVNLSAPKEPGTYKIELQKEGYENSYIYFEVKDNLFLFKLLGIIIIFVIGYGATLHFLKPK